MRVSVGFGERVRAVGGNLKGRWDMGGILELALGCLEERMVRPELFYPAEGQATTEELRAMVEDMR